MKSKMLLRLLLGIYSANDYIVIGRKLSKKSLRGGRGLIKTFLKWKYACIGEQYNLEISNFDNIGENLVLAHPSGITINPRAVIGDNCVIFKNATIGSVRSGKREGVPIIGNNCVIGTGAFVCGGISIGNNVLIAANSFVDFDVPSHSLVLGNPGVIYPKENATIDYSGIEGF